MPWRIRAVAASSVLAVLCVGCLPSTLVKPTFMKPGGTEADLNRDSYECERDTYPARIKGVRERQDFFNRCMIARGWTIQRKTGAGPGSGD